MRWEAVREGDLPFERHAQLAALLRAAFAHFPEYYAGSCPHRRVRYSRDDTSEPRPFVDEVSDTTMILPVRACVDDWPSGDVGWHGASV